MTYAFEATGLVKRFGPTVALAGVHLAARQGTVLGVLGPNGAGKTTAVRILATLLRPEEGHAAVAGPDVVRDGAKVRREVGLTGQYASVDETLTGTENLILHRTAARPASQRREGTRPRAAHPVRPRSGGRPAFRPSRASCSKVVTSTWLAGRASR